MISYPLLTEQEQARLHAAMLFMKMEELQHACTLLNLPDVGKKTVLIKRIEQFISTGQIIPLAQIPDCSRAKKHPHQPLHADSLMLYGSYKNDYATRDFFKKLIGPAFHFTAFGIDWLNKRWMQGSPPTYQEFANYWVVESQRRQQTPEAPKKEWAYINFVQQMQVTHPYSSKAAVMQAWKTVQAENAQYALGVLTSIAQRIKA